MSNGTVTDFDRKFFLKNIYEDLCYFNNDFQRNRISVGIKRAVYTEKGIKEICSVFRYIISRTTSNIYECVVKYANFNNIDLEKTSVHDIYEQLLNEITKELFDDQELEQNRNRRSIHDSLSLSKLINTIKTAIKRCDDLIEFVQMVYRVDSQNDERFPKISKEDMLQCYNGYYGNINCVNDEYEHYNEDYITADKTTPEYGKLVCKRLRAIKSDIISATNKYLGKNSKFSDFNIIDMIV